MSNDYFKAQGWFKTYALNSQDSRGVFQELVKEDEEAFRLASAESDRIKAMMNEKYGPGTVKYGSEIKQPEIKTPQAIFEFSQRNPAAEGGRQGYKNAKLVIQPPKMTEEKQKISSTSLKEDYLGQLKDKRKVRTSSLDDAIEVRNIIIKNKGHVGNIEELGRLANILVAGKSGKVDPRKTKLALDLALDSFEELEGFKLADAKYPKINTKKFRYLDMVAKSFANHNTAKNSLEASAHLLQDNMAKIVDMGGRETLEKGFFNLRGKITNADKKFISERVAVLTGKDFNIDSVNELIEETSKVRRSEGSIASKLKRYAKQNEDIKNLYNDSTIQKLIKGDLDNKTRQKILDRAVDIVGDDVAIASRRLFMMAESMAGTRPIEGIVENKNLGNKLIDTQRIIGKDVKDGRAFSSLVYNHYAKTIDNALGTGPGKSFLGYYQQKIKNALDKGLVPDEIFSVTASARRGMHPYAIFTQALDADVNSSIKGANLDGLLSKTHRDLQEIFKGRTYDKLNTAEKKSVQELVGTFENAKKNVLKDLKPEVRNKIQLAEFDLKNPPSKSIANYDSYDKNLQKAFDKSFKDTGYSMKVTKDMKTQKEFLKDIDYIDGKKDFVGFSSGFNTDLVMQDKTIQKIVNSKAGKAVANGLKNAARSGAGAAGKVFGIADIVLGVLDLENNLSKGESFNVAAKNAVQAASINLWKVGDEAKIEEIKERFVAQGGDGKIFDQATALNKKDQEINDLIYAKKRHADKVATQFGENPDFGFNSTIEDKKEYYNTLKKESNEEIAKAISERDDMIRSYKTNLQVSEAGAPINIGGSEFFGKPFKNIKRETIDRIEEENKFSYPMQKRQLVPTAGNIGNWLLNNVMTLDPQEKIKMQKYINEMDERELYKFNLERGMDPDNLIRFEDILRYKTQFPELMGVNTSEYINRADRKSEGGITELRSKYEYKK